MPTANAGFADICMLNSKFDICIILQTIALKFCHDGVVFKPNKTLSSQSWNEIEIFFFLFSFSSEQKNNYLNKGVSTWSLPIDKLREHKKRTWTF